LIKDRLLTVHVIHRSMLKSTSTI